MATDDTLISKIGVCYTWVKVNGFVRFWVFLFFLTLPSCKPLIIYGSLFASITPPSGSAANVNINFTAFSGVFNSGKLNMTFSSGEGDQMVLSLVTTDGKVKVDTYLIDNSGGNTFAATVQIPSNQKTVSFGLTSTNGFVNVKTVTFNGTALKSIGGDYKVNLVEGGTGQGDFNVTIP